MNYLDESFTLAAAGGSFAINARSCFAKRIAEAKAPLFQKERRLQFLIGEQKPLVQMRALFLNECTRFRLPSLVEVALPNVSMNPVKLFELGVNTLVFTASFSKKEASRLSWSQFYERILPLREQGFKIALALSSATPAKEMRSLSTHFDFLWVEENREMSTSQGDALAYENILREIQSYESLGLPLIYNLKGGARLHPQALFLLTFSVKPDTCIAFDAVRDGQAHPFFAEQASYAVRSNARLVPLFENRCGLEETLIGQKLFGAGIVVPHMPIEGSETERTLFSLCNRMWSAI